MQALPGGGVEANFSTPSSYLGIPRIILGSAAAQPHQTRGQDAADLAEVWREVGIDRAESGACHPLPLLTQSVIRITPKLQIGFDFYPLRLIERKANNSRAAML